MSIEVPVSSDRLSPRILLLTPLVAEQRYLLAACEQVEPLRPVDGLRLPCYYASAWETLLAVGGHGKSQSAVHTQYLLDRFPTVELVICAGAAGSLDSTVSVGDVVVGTETIEHDYRLLFATRPLPRFAGDDLSIAALRRAADRVTGFTCHYGVIASGDEDVVSAERAMALRQQTAAICVAWEGSGAARAARFSVVRSIELRAITDTADKEAPQSFEVQLPTAMRNLAALVVSLLDECSDRSRVRT